MYSTMDRLFETYGAPIMNEINRFPSREIDDLLDSLPIEKKRRVDIYDKARLLFYQSSVDAFSIGLHLGLSLTQNDNIRRPGPEQV